MQLDDESLYAAGLSLIEQNLQRLDGVGAFTIQVTFMLVLLQSYVYLAPPALGHQTFCSN